MAQPKPRGLTEAEISTLAEIILCEYPSEILSESFATFEWRKVRNPQAWAARISLQSQLQDALTNEDVEALSNILDDIHVWGFGSKIRAETRQSPGFFEDVRTCLKSFCAPVSATAQRVACLEAVLLHPRVKIATASKWLCFVDQSRYAIYDSRVSTALRRCILDQRRYFPIVGRRPGRKKPFMQDGMLNNAAATAWFYTDYVRVLEQVLNRAPELQSPAHIEAALFMLGDVCSTQEPKPNSLAPGLWRQSKTRRDM